MHRLILFLLFLKSFLYYGRKHYCPICQGHFRKFLPFGSPQRENARCPRCFSLERHRLIWEYLNHKTTFFKERMRVLHLAPEYCLRNIFKSLPNLDYFTADLYDVSARLIIDITNIAFPNNSFDCVLCSHVLEHIPDDRKAMKELFRVLKPGGWAILQVPIKGKKTFEDLTITSPKGRLKHFGQSDHVRIYGQDYKERLESVGFSVTVDDFVRHLPDDRVFKRGLVKSNDVYFCQKVKE